LESAPAHLRKAVSYVRSASFPSIVNGDYLSYPAWLNAQSAFHWRKPVNAKCNSFQPAIWLRIGDEARIGQKNKITPALLEGIKGDTVIADKVAIGRY
jgi:hypothetical protein